VSEWIEQDKVRAMQEARKAVDAGTPDTPIQISALALYLLARTITRQHGEIESLLLDAESSRRDVNSTGGISLGVELATLRHALADVDDSEWHADGCTVRAVDDHSHVASAYDRKTAVYLAILDPRFVKRLLAELDRLSISPQSPV
jgi:hypothetical protein